MHGQGRRPLGISCARTVYQVPKHVAGTLVSKIIDFLENAPAGNADSEFVLGSQFL